MPSPNSISVEKLSRLIGRPDSPLLIDVCTEEDFATNPRLVPGAVRRPWADVPNWGPSFVAAGKPAVVVCKKGLKLSQGVAAWLRHEGLQADSLEGGVVACQKGLKLSQGVAAWLRHEGVVADTLEGGVVAWASARLPMVPAEKLPKRDAQGRTVWVTRSRPKVDRIACPWLIRRFVDPGAVFLFVSPSDVLDVADRFGATPFDVDHPSVRWSHRGELCTFDVMIEEFDLQTEALRRLAAIVRGADTGKPELTPESPGLLAASLGLSRMYSDDLEQLEAGMGVYDAFYRWCRDAVGEGHDWPPTTKKS